MTASWRKCMAICLCLLLLGGCTGSPADTSDNAEASPTVATSPTPSPLEPTPSYGLKKPEVIKSVTIKKARQWNDFAQSYNDETENYAEPLTVVIAGELNFEKQDFIPLTRPFSGTIRGKGEVEGYTEQNIRGEMLFPGGMGGWYGFHNIKDITQNGGIFGTQSGDLTIENITFSGIHSQSYYPCIIANSADNLTLRNIIVADCSMRNTTAMLVKEVNTLEMDNVFVTRCNVVLITEGGGLFRQINGDAVFSRVSVMLTDVVLSPDGGGSGYAAGSTALLASRIEGAASFEQINVYHSSVYSLNSAVLCQTAGEATGFSDITVRSSSFLGFPVDASPFDIAATNRLLFGKSMSPLPVGDNILLQDSMFNVFGDFEDYTGYVIENCLSVPVNTTTITGEELP